ncbi:sulfate/molybdate ABC transporter ATP-binding protein [Mesobacillus subterraneus]|uniref:ABC transporter ATP-binding protein n=1 Tax=Mesobacillus subterraneus TaxID=285983 RepID=A0A427TWX7_9BACI|nr:ABC transporter ATP-binding protein [Mesobacillus subterraneus]RSD28988.1 ABC transporter ATP-binding protein [Mesobacillus subterraneus]
MLTVDISKTLKHFKLNASFEASKGITGIIGPSGCGKSVTLQCLSGLLTPDHGKILLNGKPLFQPDQRINLKAKDRKIGYVFQNYALFPHMTVEQNIEFGLKGLLTAEKKQKVSSMIEKVQLSGYEKHYPAQLSGGQQQRVALARTLVTEPDLLLLDEPFSALDHHVKHLLEQELMKILKENYEGIVLLVTHNMEEAYRLCDQIILYDQGQIIQAGRKEEIFEKPKNITSAKIIGCQNIIPVDSITETQCQVQGLTLKLEKQHVTENISHIGIFSENIHFNEDNQSLNAFPFKITDIVKGIHQTNLTVKTADAITLIASVPNEIVDQILKKKMYLVIPPQHLLILEKR